MTIEDEPTREDPRDERFSDGANAWEAHPRALKIQTIIMQSSGGMTRTELEEYADELAAEGLLKDTDHTT
jgi:hypothetical protein